MRIYIVVLDQVLKSYLEHICGKSNVKTGVPLSKYTTFGIGGPAKFLVDVKSKGILVRLLSALKYIEHPHRIIGMGSNLLVSDYGYDGVIIRLKFQEIIENGNIIYADAGASLVSVSRYAEALGLSGLEFACGIPGTVGGAVYGNAGAFGSSISDVVVMVDVLRDGQIISVDNKDCKFGYRTSVFKKGGIILGAYFFLRHDDASSITARMQEYTERRLASQPAGHSAGSIFRNHSISGSMQHVLPQNTSAGAMIDNLGLKGFSIGGAQVSTKHANFIINTGGATAGDVKKLIALIKKRVKATYGITLKAEIEMI